MRMRIEDKKEKRKDETEHAMTRDVSFVSKTWEDLCV